MVNCYGLVSHRISYQRIQTYLLVLPLSESSLHGHPSIHLLFLRRTKEECGVYVHAVTPWYSEE